MPISEASDRCDAGFAQSWFLWLFAQPELPERAVAADPDAWYPGSPETICQEN